MPYIVLDQLTKRYSRQAAPVLQALSLAIDKGELVALLGPSGSGKSTILKLIAGIEQPDSGDIRLNDRSLLGVPAQQRSALLLFQKAYLFPFMTVGENIGFGLKVQRASRSLMAREVARMLELVGLPGIEPKRPDQLSGGEQQRVALARALIVKPQVLLLDEPLSSLDAEIRQTLQTVIREVQRELGITMLLVTHDLSEAIALADRLALLLNGTIEAFDQPERVFQRPPTRLAAQFVGISTFLSGQASGRQLLTKLGQLHLATVPLEATPTFAIRPEHLRLLSKPALNALPGIVHDLIYKGEFTEYEIALSVLNVRAKVYQHAAQFSRGETVYVQFPPEHLFEVF